MSVSMVGSTGASMGVGTRAGSLSTSGGHRSAADRRHGPRVVSYLGECATDSDQGAMVMPSGGELGTALSARFGGGARVSAGQGCQHRLGDGEEGARGHRRGLSGDCFDAMGEDSAGFDAKTLSSLEEAPRTRPVVAQQSLRCIRAVGDLTELDGSGSQSLPNNVGRYTGLAGAEEWVSPSMSSPSSWCDDVEREARSAFCASSAHPSTSSLGGASDGASSGVPVYVMLPLDCVTSGGLLKYVGERWFKRALLSLRASGCRGVMVDLWWGAVERKPRVYDWTPYLQLIKAVKAAGLKMQVVFSFHACGSNVGDTCSIPLPKWVLAAGTGNEEIFFTDRPRDGEAAGQRNRECLSIWADREPVLDGGRTPLECYEQFMASFRDAAGPELGNTITEVCVGTGPCGELRYPSYPMHTDRGARAWRFPGVGEFQCYDRYALAHLAASAGAVGRPEWGRGGPADAGCYNSRPEETGFFGGGEAASYMTDYGRFFLEWYSGCLLGHGDRMLKAAAAVFGAEGAGRKVDLSLKCAGVHWWYNAPSHAAELTAGYYNVEGRCGYGPILDLCRAHGARLIFTCVEMCDDQHPPDAACGPEGLLRQVRAGAARRSVGLAGENALPCHNGEGRFNAEAMGRIVANSSATLLAVPSSPGPSKGPGVVTPADVWNAAAVEDVIEVPPMVGFTFLRLAPDVVDHPRRAQWDEFVDGMASSPAGSPAGPRPPVSSSGGSSLARDGSRDSLSSSSSASSRTLGGVSSHGSTSSSATHAPESPVVSVLGSVPPKGGYGMAAAAAARGRGPQEQPPSLALV